MDNPTIAVDVMGGDNAPDSILDGVRLACEEYDVDLLLVGPEDLIRDFYDGDLPGGDRLRIRHASETIRMDENPLKAIRRKKDSSLNRAADAVKDGDAHALVSAGNTGAVHACTKIKWGVQERVDRPAIATLMPSRKGGYSVLIDVGANVDSDPHQLVQFGAMGSVYSELVLGVDDPTIGLLNLGIEEMKGNNLTKQAFSQFQNQPLNFYGNVEGRDIINGTTDVIVCDGFVGNIALKLSEGVAETIFDFIRDEIERSFRAKLGGMLLKPYFKNLKEMVDYSEYGGAPLLGLNGGCIISHGSSNPNAIKNAIRVARLSMSKECNRIIGERLQTLEFS